MYLTLATQPITMFLNLLQNSKKIIKICDVFAK
jgi:hypothetical protein